MKYTLALAVATLFGLVTSVPVVTHYQQDLNQCGRHEELVGHNCECKEGYVRFRGQCTRCPPDARFSCKYKTCKCNDNFVWDSEANVCREVYEPTPTRSQVSQQTQYGESETPYRETPTPTRQSTGPTVHVYPTQSQQSGQSGQSGQSQQSGYSSASYQEPSSNRASNQDSASTYVHHEYVESQGNCGINERVTPGGRCDCRSGFARLDGVNCLQCPRNGHWDVNANNRRGGCVCNFDFRLENNECVPDCGVNERFTAGGGCDCRQGFVRYNGVDCVRACPAQAYWSVQNQGCVCEWGLQMNQATRVCEQRSEEVRQEKRQY